MADAETKNPVDEALAVFRQQAATHGTTFDQAIEKLLDANRKLSPVERVAVSAYFRSQHPDLQPSLPLDEIREGLM